MFHMYLIRNEYIRQSYLKKYKHTMWIYKNYAVLLYEHCKIKIIIKSVLIKMTYNLLFWSDKKFIFVFYLAKKKQIL